MRTIARIGVAIAAAVAIGVALWHLESATDGLTVTRTHVGTTPVTVFAAAGGGRAPVVVIGHGFAGSQQLMLPFAVTLARNGYVAVTFDFPGHGRNPVPLLGGLANDAQRNGTLLDSLGAVVAFARALPQGDGRIGLLGHSMASDIVVRYAQQHPDIAATVAVSLFSPSLTATSPGDLLVIVGALEPAMIRDEGARVVGLAAGGAAVPRVTYGHAADGTARRLSLSGGVEHIGVLFSRQSLAEALDWFNAAFERHGDGWLDARADWLGVLYLGLVALAWPLTGLLPRAAAAPVGAGPGWRRLLPVAVAPAVLTPLILWKLPTDFLPSLLGDYLTVHYAVYGLLTGCGLWLTRRARPAVAVSWPAVGGATACLALYFIVAIGLPIDRYVTSFVPTPARALLMPVMVCGTAVYFVADEWLVRGSAAARGGEVATKLCFLLSLAFAIALNPPRLFFLIIIVPVILLFLAVYGVFAAWAYRRTWHPLPGALANALAFAWAIAVTFPVVG